jgi:RNA polymerase sigma factor (TIGR02999 family)
MEEKPPITSLLHAWQEGDEAALSALADEVYDELHRIAARIFSNERLGHTLQPTALVNEAFINLVNADVTWQDRAHFFALSARMMRRVLVDHVRSRNAQKRGGGSVPVTLNEELVSAGDYDERLEALDAAITELAAVDERKARLVEMQIFGGLSFREMSAVSGLSSSTLDRELRTAKAWLQQAVDRSI